MKILFFCLFALTVLPLTAQDEALLKKIGARTDAAGNIMIGCAFLRKNDRTISFPGRINIRQGTIEVLVSTRRGRMHESLIVTELDPFQLQMALILAGYRNGDRNTADAFHIEVIPDTSVRIPIEEWLYDSTAEKNMSRGSWFFAGSSFREGRCLASLEGNLININSLDKNTVLNAALDKDAAMHEYIVRKDRMPQAKLKNPDSPLEGFEDTPVRVLLIPASGKQSNRKCAPERH